LLSDSPHRGRATFDSVLEDASRGVARDRVSPGEADAGRAMREQFLDVVRKAKSLKERAGVR
jgi:4-hydroxy-3-methylbut-2-en-1-yl diphosphate synthase IspG/GcpE